MTTFRRGTQGMMQVDYEQRMDMDRMREHRVSRIKKYMDVFDIECLLLFDTGNKRYSTSTAVCSPEIDNMGRYAIIPRNGPPHIFGFGSEVANEKLHCPWIADYTFPAHGTMFGALPMEWNCHEGFLKDLDMVLDNYDLDKKKIRIGVDVVESQIILAMQAGGYTLADGQGVVQHARSIKNEDEIMILKHAAAIVDAAFHQIAITIRPGIKENDLQAVASAEMHRLGAQWIHNVQVTSGNRTNPHPHLSSDRMIQPGDVIFMDVVCLFNGYHTCVYRCFTCGEPSQQQKDCHSRCLEIQTGGIEAVKPGATTADIVTRWPDYRQMGALNEHEIFGLQYGHGIGVGLWEFPIISRAYSIEHPVVIEPGMVFALETYAGSEDGHDGVRLEDEVVVTDTGIEIITKFPTDRIIGCGMNY
jgi:Xaa-Pro aminopeptidase